MIQELSKWLADKKRSYAVGVALFIVLAAAEIQRRYALYFQEVKNPSPTSEHFSMLVNKLTSVERAMLQNPKQYAHPKYRRRYELLMKEQTPKPIQEENEELNEQLQELQYEKDELEEEKENLEEQNNELQEQNEQLSQTVADLKTKPQTPLKVVHFEQLPADLQEAYQRVQEIIPLRARLHAELSAEIPNEKRQKLADELCRLEDERLAIWNKLDAWAKANHVDIHETQQPELPETPIPQDFDIATRIDRLKENIQRSNKAAVAAKAAGKANVEKKALQRVADYQKELDELQAQLNGLEKQE